MLIGNHVITAPFLKESDIEVLSTGYMLIDNGKSTSVSYMSNTTPVPHDKDDIAVCTAIAGEMLGLKMIYMDGGSGAINTISGKMITVVANNIDVPLICQCYGDQQQLVHSHQQEREVQDKGNAFHAQETTYLIVWTLSIFV